MQEDPVTPLLTETERHELKGVVREFPPDAPLCREGELTKETFLLIRGHVKITFGGPDRIIAVRGPGETVGEMAALDDLPRSASVYAMEEVLVLEVSQADWLDFVFDPAHRRVGKALYRQLSLRIREASAKQSQARLFSVERRLAQRLLELVNTIGQSDGQTVVIEGISQEQLAGMVGTKTRDSVAQVMGAFRRRGVVTTARMKITIHDLPLLRRVAEATATVLASSV